MIIMDDLRSWLEASLAFMVSGWERLPAAIKVRHVYWYEKAALSCFGRVNFIGGV
jgi:hypothetical protein